MAATYPATPATMVVSQPHYMVPPSFREVPVTCTCTNCRATITTSTAYEVGTFTWLACFIIAFVGCWLGCCLIPFCLSGTKDVIHTCPNCKAVVGKYSRM